MPTKNYRTAKRRKRRHHDRIQKRHNDAVIILDPETVDGQGRLVPEMLLHKKEKHTSRWSNIFSNMWTSVFG